ncbi:MAG TPA: hypothetical protein VK191_14140 [Symbiobacteriaceae bacterium]|nr:hypothetical protein [Symbiobacteriaceae bacterium]
MRSDPFGGRYLFHLHTTYTDGEVPVAAYFEWGRRAGLDRLIFLEHIRTKPSYDVRAFIAEVKHAARTYGLPARVGFEAKLLPGGALDISPEHAAQADVLGLAEHGFPPDFDLWHASLRTALANGARQVAERPVVWVHPGLWLKRQGLLAAHEQEYRALLAEAQTLGIKLEWNLRYDLVPVALRGALPPGSLVIGADAHRLTDAEVALTALGAENAEGPPASI